MAMFQSTRPRGARLVGDRVVVTKGRVSIHAPAWGATRLSLILVESLLVSIHAPAWGATCNAWY